MTKILNIIVTLCIVLGASAHRRNVDNFMGRSGQMIVELPEENIHDDSAVLFKGKYFEGMDMETVKDVQIMDLYTYVEGLPAADLEASHEGYPTASLFNTPKAALIVNIAGAGAKSLEENPGMPITKGAKEISVTSTSYPLNTHVLLNNMATGTSASVHGIVGRTWTSASGTKMGAHEGRGSQSLASNIADVLVQQYKGKSLIVSASASKSYASIFAVHPQIAAPGYNAHAYALSDKFNLLSIYNHPQPVAQNLALPQYLLQEILTGVKFHTMFSTSHSSGHISYNGVSFNLKTKADSRLFAELAFAYNLIEQLTAGGSIESLVRDEFPDLFTITFSGLKSVKHKYGADSEEYKAALHLVSEAASHLSDAINTAYNTESITIVTYVNPHHTIPSELKENAYKAAKPDMSPQEFERNFPAIYQSAYTTSAAQREETCGSLQRDLGLQVHCFSTISSSFLYTVMDDGNNTNQTNQTNFGQMYRDSKYVTQFWILFFISIILLSFVLWGVYNLTFVGGDG